MNAHTEEKPVVDTVSLPSDPAEHSPSPGAMIRAARDRAHLSLDELAAQTKLARHTLEALERDDYKALLEPVYVRGYYRKCAKVLDIPERELIDAYQSRVEPRSPAAPSKLRLASGTELGSNSRLPVALAAFFALIAVVICGFLWFWRGQLETVPASIASRAGTTTTSEPAPSPAPEISAPEAAAPTLPSVAGPTTSPADAPASTAPAASAAPAAESGTSAPPPPAAASGAASVTLVVSQTSWVRVDDGNGKTLFNSLVNTGETQTISGLPPLSVFLGNAPGVAVEFEGKPVDIKKYTRGTNVARFTLPLAP